MDSVCVVEAAVEELFMVRKVLRDGRLLNFVAELTATNEIGVKLLLEGVVQLDDWLA